MRELDKDIELYLPPSCILLCGINHKEPEPAYVKFTSIRVKTSSIKAQLQNWENSSWKLQLWFLLYMPIKKAL